MFQHKYNQTSLFEASSDAALMFDIMSMQKIDLHRHLTGSIDAETAIKIASKYSIELPTYIASELQNILYESGSIKTLKEYFSPWTILNKLFVSREAVYDIIIEIIKKAAQDNVAYLELRMGPHGFLGKSVFTFDKFVETVSLSIKDAETMFGTIARCILGIPRHIFGPISFQTKNKMLGSIISIISSFYPDCFVGVDLNGDETAFDGEEFKVFFKMAKYKNFKITVHAGECGPPSNVQQAIDLLNAQRIGHGLASIKDTNLLQKLSEKNCALEICPTSNKVLGLISKIGELPLEIFKNYGVPFVICTDNPARCKTSLSEELFKIAKSFSLSFSDIQHITYLSFKHSFADEETKKKIELKLNRNNIYSSRKFILKT